MGHCKKANFFLAPSRILRCASLLRGKERQEEQHPGLLESINGGSIRKFAYKLPRLNLEKLENLNILIMRKEI